MPIRKLDDNEVEQLLRAGKTQEQVVSIYRTRGIDIAQSTISLAIKSGRIKVDTNRHKGGIPWKLNPEHRHLHAARMLRSQARLDAGLEVGPSLRKQVASWIAGLEHDNAVIHYDPETPEGFWRVERREGIDQWWVRDPRLDDHGNPTRA